MVQDKNTSDCGSNNTEHRVKGSEIFVGGLSHSTTESMIREIFSPYGEIVELRMMLDQSGISKGFCFVRFATKEAAFKARKEKDGIMLHGKKIGIAPSDDQDSLFFGNLRKDWSSEEFDRLVRQSFKDVVSVDLAMSSSTGGSPADKNRQNRGFAFVQFSSHAAAARAYRMRCKPEFLLGDCHPIIDWAETENEIDPEELAKIKTAFVGNLPTNADEDFLKGLFEPLGKVERVALSRKGRFPVGFIHFASRLDLDNAIKKMDGKTVQGPQKGPSFKIQVAVAKPAEKDKKRVRDEAKSKLSNKSNVGVTPDPLNHKSKVPRLANVVAEITDPYEEAVLALPSAVKERLLKVLRLGVATRYDVDIRCITSLQQLPESAAITVLDQFLLSGADKHDKVAYFISLVARHRVDKLGSRWNSPYLPLKTSNFATKEPELFNSWGPLPSQTIDSSAARYSSYNSSASMYPYSSTASIDPLAERSSLGKSGELSYRNPIPSIEGYGAGTSSSIFSSFVDRQERVERPQIRFDPFTGQPYKFDPFTGEPIRPESHPQHSASIL